MKCEYCNKEIPAGTEIEFQERFFCNSLHRYYWQSGQKYEETNSDTPKNINSGKGGPGAFAAGVGGKFMFDKKNPMNLGDIFSVAFNLIKTTFFRNLVIASVFLVPAGILLGFGFQSYFSNISEFINGAKDSGIHSASVNEFISIFKAMVQYFFTLGLFMLAYLAVIIGITKIGCGQMELRRTNLPETFKEIFSSTYLRGLGAGLLMVLAAIAYGMAVIVIVAIAKIADDLTLDFIAGVFIFAGVLFLVYLYIRWYFVLISLVHKGEGIFRSFSDSSRLVKGQWWRIFGIIILISIFVNFAVSIISTPISFGLMWGYISQYFKSMSENSFAGNNPEAVFELLKSFGLNMGIVMALSMILNMLITPLFNIVIYFDSKIRKNDYEQVSYNTSDFNSFGAKIE